MYLRQNVLASKCHGAHVAASKCLATKFLAPKCLTAGSNISSADKIDLLQCSYVDGGHKITGRKSRHLKIGR